VITAALVGTALELLRFSELFSKWSINHICLTLLQCFNLAVLLSPHRAIEFFFQIYCTVYSTLVLKTGVSNMKAACGPPDVIVGPTSLFHLTLFVWIRTLVAWLKSTLLLKIECRDTPIYMFSDKRRRSIILVGKDRIELCY